MRRVNEEPGGADRIHNVRGFADSLSETPPADTAAVGGVKAVGRPPPIGQGSSESVGRI